MTITPHDASELFRRKPERLLDVGAGEVAYRRVGRGPDVLFECPEAVSTALLPVLSG